MKVWVIIVLLSVLCYSCDDHEKNTAIIKSFDKEIDNRRSILNRLNQYDNSLSVISDSIHNEVYKLLLLSKDSENISACVNKGNLFFNNMADRYNIRSEHCTTLKTLMFPHELEIALKQNELSIYNQIIFNNGLSDIQLFSAGETISE